MTLFDIMPSIWLFSSFCFFIFYLICQPELSLCAVSSSLFSFAFSLLALPIYVQCFSFIGICSALLIICCIKSRIHHKEKHIFCAVSRINSLGGFAKHHGKIIEVCSRDKYISYPTGEVFFGKKSNDGFILWAKNS